MEDVNLWKSVWTSAKTDSNRIQALSLLSKVLKKVEVTDDQRKDVLETVGLSFLLKLLMPDPSHGFSPDQSKEISLAILSSFCADSQIMSEDFMYKFVEPVNRILYEITLPINKQLILDALNVLLSMTAQEKCRRQMLIESVFATLSFIYCCGPCGQETALDVLICLVSFSEVEATVKNQEAFDALLAKMSEQFFSDSSRKKFTYCKQILMITLKCTSFLLKIETATTIRDTLAFILQNKLLKEDRDNAIILASLLINKQGRSLFPVDFEGGKIFFLILAQLCCVEIRMLLEEKTVFEVIGESVLLTACYTVFEFVIITMVDDKWFEANRVHASPLLASIKITMAVALDFLKKAESECTHFIFNIYKLNSAELVVLSTIRVISSWLAEETFALQEKVGEALPFILNICKLCFQQIKTIERQAVDIDPFRFFMSPLQHLTADNRCREILLGCDLLNLLQKYFECTWTQYKSEPEDWLTQLLTTMCGIFLNIVVLEPNLGADMDLFSFLKLLFSDLPSMPRNLVLKANFAVLGLLITKHCHRKVKGCETNFYGFLSASIKFLWDAHYIETRDNYEICHTRAYRNAWVDIMELWFLGMQALCSLIPMMPWIADYLDDTGWPTAIMKMFWQGSNIEGNTKLTYQALLCTLVRVSEKCKERVFEEYGIAVCDKHNLTELKGLLSDNMQ